MDEAGKREWNRYLGKCYRRDSAAQGFVHHWLEIEVKTSQGMHTVVWDGSRQFLPTVATPIEEISRFGYRLAPKQGVSKYEITPGKDVIRAVIG